MAPTESKTKSYEELIEALWALVELRRRYEKRNGKAVHPGMASMVKGGVVGVSPGYLADALLRKGGLSEKDADHLRRIRRKDWSRQTHVLKALDYEDARVLGLGTLYLEEVRRTGWLNPKSEMRYAGEVDLNAHYRGGLDQKTPDERLIEWMVQEATDRGYDGAGVSWASGQAASMVSDVSAAQGLGLQPPGPRFFGA